MENEFQNMILLGLNVSMIKRWVGAHYTPSPNTILTLHFFLYYHYILLAKWEGLCFKNNPFPFSLYSFTSFLCSENSKNTDVSVNTDSFLVLLQRMDEMFFEVVVKKVVTNWHQVIQSVSSLQKEIQSFILLLRKVRAKGKRGNDGFFT